MPEIIDPKSKAKVLYDEFSSNYDLGKFDDFYNKLQDNNKRKLLYDAVSKDYDLGTFEDFSNKVVSKKKVSPLQAPSPSSATPSFSQYKEQGYKQLEKDTSIFNPELSDFQKYEQSLSRKATAYNWANSPTKAAAEPRVAGNPVAAILNMFSPDKMAESYGAIGKDIEKRENIRQNAEVEYKKYEEESNNYAKNLLPTIKEAVSQYSGKLNKNGVPDYGKISQLSRQLSSQLGGGDYVSEVIRGQLENQERFAIIEPNVKKEYEKIVKKEKGLSFWLNIQPTERKKIENSLIQKQLVTAQKIKQAETLASTEYKKTELEATERYKPLIAAAQINGNEEELNGIVNQYYTEMKGIAAKINNRVKRTRDELVNQFNSEIQKAQLPESEIKYLNDTYQKAYSNVVKGDLEAKKIIQQKEESLIGYTGIFGKSLLSGLLSGISNRGSGLVGIGLGGSLSDFLYSFKSGAEIAETVDLDFKGNMFNPTTYLTRLGKQVGYQLPSMVVTALTKNPTIGGMVGFVDEQLQNGGDVYEQILSETGDPVKAQQATARYWYRSLPTIPLYYLESSMFLKYTGLKKGNVLANVVAEVPVEVTQELIQGYSQQLDTKDALGFKDFMSQKAPNIALETAITTLLQGGSFAALGKLGSALGNQNELGKNYIYNLLNSKGTNASFAMLELQQLNGQITEEQLLLGKENLAKVASTITELKAVGLNDTQVEGYLALLAERDGLRENLTKTSNPELISAYQKEIESINKELEQAALGKVKATTVEFTSGGKITLLGDPKSVLSSTKGEVGNTINITSTDDSVNKEVQDINSKIPQQENEELSNKIIDLQVNLAEVGVFPLDQDGMLTFTDQEGNQIEEQALPQEALELKEVYDRLNGNAVPAQEVKPTEKQISPALRDVESVAKKSDADIEKRMLELQDSGLKFGTPETKEFNALEKEMEKRERKSVFNVPLDKVGESVDALMQKEKNMPNGFGAFIEKRDAGETKEVADRYLNAKELTDAELKKDFSDAVRGNPITWYADGLKMREALKEATNRGIDTKDMLAAVTKVYEDAGYDTQTAKSVVANMLKPIFEGSQKVETNESKLVKSESILSKEQAQPTETKTKQPVKEIEKIPEEIEREERQEANISLKIKEKKLKGESLMQLGRLVPKEFYDSKKSPYNIIAKAYIAALNKSQDTKLVKAVNKLLGIKQPKSAMEIARQKAAQQNKGIVNKANKISELLQTPKDRVMAYFVSGKRINQNAIQELYGGKEPRLRWKTSIEGERRSRIGLISSTSPSINDLAHKLWEQYGEYDNFTTQDYRNAIEEVLGEHTSRATMAKELNNKYAEEIKNQGLTDEEVDTLEDMEVEMLLSIVSNIDDDIKQEIIELLESYTNRSQGGSVIDWNKLKEDSSGFEPKILNLSEKAQNKLYEIIQDPKGFANSNVSSQDVEQQKEIRQNRQQSKKIEEAEDISDDDEPLFMAKLPSVKKSNTKSREEILEIVNDLINHWKRSKKQLDEIKNLSEEERVAYTGTFSSMKRFEELFQSMTNEVVEKIKPFLELLGFDIKEKNNIKLLEEISSSEKLMTGKVPNRISRKAFDKLVEKLQKAFPKAKITFNANDVKGKAATEVKTQGGIIYGATLPDGTIYLNREAMSAEAPIHEFTHLWERLMPEDWKRGLEFFKKSSGFAKALKEIQDNPAYKGLTQEQKESEAMNTILGRMGEGYFSSDMLTKFKNWFTQLLKKVADKLNLRKLTPDEKFKSFANKVLRDLFGGKDITEKQEGKKGDLQLSGKGLSIQNVQDVISSLEMSLNKGITQDQTVEQMMPITDQMAEIEKEFARRGYILENDYDTVSVRDNNDFVEPNRLPKYLQNLVAQYESAFLKLESFDETALAIALQKSRATETRYADVVYIEDEGWAVETFPYAVKGKASAILGGVGVKTFPTKELAQIEADKQNKIIIEQISRRSKGESPLFMASAPKEDFAEALNEYDNLIKNPKGTTEYIKKFGLEKIKKIKDITSNFGTYIAALEKSNYITKKIC
jgi:hypothetical protein